jgi:hypothetical protein
MAKTLKDAPKEKLENFHHMLDEITPVEKKEKINQFTALSAEQMVLFVCE